MLLQRSCGILVHITSLPGPYGVGDLDSACYFLDFLEKAGQSSWQFLPTVPGVDVFGNSPYMGLSAFAGNPLLISPDLLYEKGLLEKRDLVPAQPFSEYTVDFNAVTHFKESLFLKAFRQFEVYGHFFDDYDLFCKNQAWLDDYALFMSLREKYELQPWYKWPRKIAVHDAKSLAKASGELEDRIKYHKFVQYIFFEQWRRMRQAAKKNEISLIGDIPIYVGYDSADVWANQGCFDLDKRTLKPKNVAGVPPDYFSDTGQRWGNPLYKWKVAAKPNEPLYQWWGQRFVHIGEMVDVVRIDHFRGFASYWQVPEKEETAIHGKWVKGPGAFFFKRLEKKTRGLDIIAEDLGVITPDVIKLRDSLGFPGMKILQFAFDSDNKNTYLPHNFDDTNAVVYTGTHDNDTTVGWYYDDSVPQRAKERARRYANSDGQMIHRDFIRMAYSSVANLAVVPLQDVLGFGSDCRMNRPSIPDGNWIWRCASRFLSDEICHYLRDEARFYGREKDVLKKGESDAQSIGF